MTQIDKDHIWSFPKFFFVPHPEVWKITITLIIRTQIISAPSYCEVKSNNQARETVGWKFTNIFKTFSHSTLLHRMNFRPILYIRISMDRKFFLNVLSIWHLCPIQGIIRIIEFEASTQVHDFNLHINFCSFKKMKNFSLDKHFAECV